MMLASKPTFANRARSKDDSNTNDAYEARVQGPTDLIVATLPRLVFIHFSGLPDLFLLSLQLLERTSKSVKLFGFIITD